MSGKSPIRGGQNHKNKLHSSGAIAKTQRWRKKSWLHICLPAKKTLLGDGRGSRINWLQRACIRLEPVQERAGQENRLGSPCKMVIESLYLGLWRDLERIWFRTSEFFPRWIIINSKDLKLLPPHMMRPQMVKNIRNMCRLSVSGKMPRCQMW